jgi:hypothetical protein
MTVVRIRIKRTRDEKKDTTASDKTAADEGETKKRSAETQGM